MPCVTGVWFKILRRAGNRVMREKKSAIYKENCESGDCHDFCIPTEGVKSIFQQQIIPQSKKVMILLIRPVSGMTSTWVSAPGKKLAFSSLDWVIVCATFESSRNWQYWARNYTLGRPLNLRTASHHSRPNSNPRSRLFLHDGWVNNSRKKTCVVALLRNRVLRATFSFYSNSFFLMNKYHLEQFYTVSLHSYILADDVQKLPTSWL